MNRCFVFKIDSTNGIQIEKYYYQTDSVDDPTELFKIRLELIGNMLVISQRNSLNSKKRITILDTFINQIIAASYYSYENEYGAVGSFGQDLFVPYNIGAGLQIAKVPISMMGSVVWMTNEVMDATYFNLTAYTGILVVRLNDNPLTYSTWSGNTDDSPPANSNPTVIASVPNALTALPSPQIFQLPLEISAVSIKIEAPCSSNPGMTVTYSLETADSLLSIGANSSYDVSLNIDMLNVNVAAFGANQFFTLSNALKATDGTLTSLALFEILIFKCPNATCLTCLTYNSAEK